MSTEPSRLACRPSMTASTSEPRPWSGLAVRRNPPAYKKDGGLRLRLTNLIRRSTHRHAPVEINEDTLTMVATDRYRLAVRELRWTPVAPGLNTAVLVPARVLGDTARQMTGGAEVSVALATTEGGNDGIIGFEGSGRKTTTRLLSGEYPRYQTLLPSQFSAVAELPAAPFADAVKRVALVAERNTPVRLTFATARSCSRRAPVTRPRRARRSPPATTARRCRSRSTRRTCSTASTRWIPTRSASRSPRRPGPP